MRVAALYDIHGNLPALEAVLAEVEREEVDAVVTGGDVVGGPFPAETLARIRSIDRPVHPVRGNHESEVLDVAKGAPAPEGDAGEVARWVASQLDPGDLRALAAWPLTLRLSLGALGSVLFCHATPESDTAIFTEGTPDERVARLFAAAREGLSVCGHTHMPAERRLGPLRVVVAGSVGMPFGAPGAHWLLLDGDRGTVERRISRCDTAAAAERIRAGGYPQADAFAEGNVLATPSVEDALAVLSRMEAAQRSQGSP